MSQTHVYCSYIDFSWMKNEQTKYPWCVKVWSTQIFKKKGKKIISNYWINYSNGMFLFCIQLILKDKDWT